MNKIMDLNEKQLFIVNLQQSVLVRATPGTGKTRVLIAKVLKLLSEGVSFITLITFTKASALEIQKRLIVELGSLPEGIVVGTFHSVISKHINKHVKVGLMSNEEQVTLLHQQYNRYFGEHEGFEAFSRYFEKKVSGSSTQTNEEYEIVLDNYYNEMSNITAGMMDLISLCQRLIQEGKVPLLPTSWLLVDEFQDTDLEQVKFILSHGLSGINLLLVGDPDQSVYAFRDALGPDAFTIVSDNSNIVEASLSVNYRSYSEVLTAAQRLIEHNNNEHLVMASHLGEGGNTECFSVLNPTEEALLVSRLIKHRDCSNVAIIARSNYRLAIIETVLREQGIKFARRSTSSQFNIAELLFLSLLGALAKKSESNIVSVIEPIIKSHDLALLIAKHLFISINKPIPSNCDEITNQLKKIYHNIVRHNSKKAIDGGLDFSLNHFKSMNLDGLYKVEYLAEKLKGMKGTLQQRLFKLELNADKEECSIQTMTGHSSKGLEFDTVYLLGFSEGVFPPKSSSKYELDIEEERRIAYVEFTRAMKQLTVLSPLQTEKGRRFGGVSRFIYEAEIDVTKVLYADDYVINKVRSYYG